MGLWWNLFHFDVVTEYGLDSQLQSVVDNELQALFTQHLRIISGAAVRQFSADGDSHRAKHLCLHVCNSHRKPALRLLKRRDGTRHFDDVVVSPGDPPGVPC